MVIKLQKVNGDFKNQMNGENIVKAKKDIVRTKKLTSLLLNQIWQLSLLFVNSVFLSLIICLLD